MPLGNGLFEYHNTLTIHNGSPAKKYEVLQYKF